MDFPASHPSKPTNGCDYEQFVTALYESGVLSPGEIQAFFDSIPDDECPASSDGLADAMIRLGLLTAFQAKALCDGKARALTFGNYVVLDKLGKGGMGRLFRCMHKRMKRVVALKVLPPNSMKLQKMVARFQREVEAMARLSHPNIVTAFDAGEDKGVRFLAMEYVEGSDLATLVSGRGALPTVTAVEYALQAARGLEYAHWHGMIHRDVKPDNLMLDWRDTVKVLDLGIVGLVAGIWEPGDDGQDDESHDRFLAIGTPDYMAPEQMEGSTGLGPTCDIYGLGCTLHYLLVGKPVFAEETIEDKLRAHREQPPPSIRAGRPEVPKPLDRLFQRMIAKRPGDRPATMTEVIAELEHCLRLLQELESPAANGPRGSLLIDVREPDVALQILDDGGEVVIDCLSVQGRLTFALPAGLHRIVVRQRGRERLSEEIEIAAGQSKAVRVALAPGITDRLPEHEIGD